MTNTPPTADQIVFVSNRNLDGQVYVMDADGGNQRQLTSGNRAIRPRWSPDGTKIAFLRNLTFVEEPTVQAELMVMNADGSNLTAFSQHIGRYVADFDWSPDSKQLVLVIGNYLDFADSRLVVAAVDGSGDGTIINGFQNSAPAWSPDGTQIAFVSVRDEPNKPKLYLVNADGSNLRTIADDLTPGLAWLPSGSAVLFARNSQQPGIYRANTDGSGVQALTTHNGSVMQPVVSPDGQFVAYMVDTPGQNWGIWVVGSDGTSPVAVAGAGAVPGTGATEPTWAPDGRTLAFCQYDVLPNSMPASNRDIATIQVDGTNRRQLTQDSGHNQMPNWRQR